MVIPQATTSHGNGSRQPLPTKPYFFNRENLARYTDNRYCSTCPLARGGCPFEGSYEDVSDRIFPGDASPTAMSSPTQTELTRRLSSGQDSPTVENTKTSTTNSPNVLVWVNEEGLDPQGPALAAHPQTPAIFVFDEAAIELAGWSIKRLAFIYECLVEIPNIQVYRGSTVDILLSLLKDNGYTTITTTPVVDPRLKDNINKISKFASLQQYPVEEFAPIERVRDLRRFSRYWNDVEHVVVG